MVSLSLRESVFFFGFVMRIGLFADTHDHLDNVRWAVAYFNALQCELVLFAGDFVSTFVTPPLRQLNAPLIACFGDNDGNKRGLRNGTSILGTLGEPPFGILTADGTKILLTHMLRDLRPAAGQCDVIVYAHTHKPRIRRDERGRLLVNPGETSGWTYRQPTVALLETNPLQARILRLPDLPALPATESLTADQVLAKTLDIRETVETPSDSDAN